MTKLDNCRAVVTGASAGIGREFARQLAPRARFLLLLARRQDRLEQLRAELIGNNSLLDVEVRKADLSTPDEVVELAQSFAEDQIDLLINNAGLGDRGDFATADPARINQEVHVNVLALTLLTRAVLPGMLRRKRGSILNVSSTAGFLPLPGNAVYAATKAYVNSFTEALRVETRGWGITVTALCPGPVHTEFEQMAARPGCNPRVAPEFMHVSPERVVHAALGAVEKDKPLVIPGASHESGNGNYAPAAVTVATSSFTCGRRARLTHRSGSGRVNRGTFVVNTQASSGMSASARDRLFAAKKNWPLDHLYFTEQP